MTRARPMGVSEGRQGSGLGWGILALLVGLLLGAVFSSSWNETQRRAPAMTPISLAAGEFAGLRPGDKGRAVFVHHFEPRCEAAFLDAGELLVPASPRGGKGAGDAPVFVVLEVSSDCSRLREWATTGAVAEATPLDEDRRARLELEGLLPRGAASAVLHPTHTRWGLGLAALAALAVGGLGLRSAARTQARHRAPLRADAPATDASSPVVEADFADVHGHPYRGPDDPRAPLLLGELRPKPAHLAELGRGRRRWTLAGASILALVLGLSALGLGRIGVREWAWAHGSKATTVLVEGERERLAGVLTTTWTQVSYPDDEGGVHRAQRRVRGLLLGVDDDLDPSLRFLPGDPERYCLSWEHELRGASLALWSILTALGMALGWSVLSTGRKDRSVELTRAVFEDPRELLLDVVLTERDGADVEQVHFRGRGDARERVVRIEADRPRPLFLDTAERVGLALYTPANPAFLLLLHADLGELDGLELDATQIRARYRASVAARRAVAPGADPQSGPNLGERLIDVAPKVPIDGE